MIRGPSTKYLFILFALLQSVMAQAAEKSSPTSSSAKFVNGEIRELAGFIIGGSSLSIDGNFRISPSWTLGPTIFYKEQRKFNDLDRIKGVKTTGFGLGARAVWHKNGAFTDGFYFSPTLEYAFLTVTGSAAAIGEASSSANVLIATATIGYYWFWQLINIHVGGGASTAANPNSITLQAGTINQNEKVWQPGILLDLGIGATF